MLVDHNNIHPDVRGNDNRPGGASAEVFTTKPGEWMKVETTYVVDDKAPWYEDDSVIGVHHSEVRPYVITFKLRNLNYYITKE